MKKNYDLLKGPIIPALSALALPIMATSLIQMAYNMTDMIWIGQIGSGAVASVGAAGMYMWLSNGLATLAKMGGQIKVAQSIGSKSYKDAKAYARASFQMGILFAIIFGIIALLFGKQMIDFFQLNSEQVAMDATRYLMITSGLVVFSFVNQIFTGVLTAMGNSRTSFLATSVGLAMNIILDPLFIFGFGFIPALGVVGAAIATVLAQSIVTLLFIYSVRKETMIFTNLQVFRTKTMKHMKEIFRIGFPTALQSMLFSSISMVIARLIAGWGDAAVAVQKVGSQIESISWMTSEGYAAALNSFVAQNYGANNPERIKQGYYASMWLMLAWGILCTILLLVFPQMIFRIFIQESDVLPLGVDYLRILALSEYFMCIEITTAGAFNGLGKTMPPSLISISLTALRIPLAIWLSGLLGLNGIWWTITISSILKGIVLTAWFYIILKKPPFVKTKEIQV
ncbi:MAG: MATE family efflux transporter [Erysipelotrichaceae bacterium]|nr:MATE family efflux transporter [Erysipelotrichaceae bacterium]MCI9524955.1 MATE family efflux transporter [Erysipelotrichaceae bacterium]